MENRIRKFGDATKVIAGGPGSAGIWYDSATGVTKVNPGEATDTPKQLADLASVKTVTAVDANGAIAIRAAVPVQLININKAGSAAAVTLAAPTAAQAGHQLIITSGSAFAHVVTATTLLEDGVVGGPKTTATFAAFKGASLHLVAVGLFWHVVSKNVVTIT